jgi:hypothetical protein
MVLAFLAPKVKFSRVVQSRGPDRANAEATLIETFFADQVPVDESTRFGHSGTLAEHSWDCEEEHQITTRETKLL